MRDYSIVSRSAGLFLHFELPNEPFRHLNTVIISLLSSPDEISLLSSTIPHTMGFTFSHYSAFLPLDVRHPRLRDGPTEWDMTLRVARPAGLLLSLT